jgi:hypothetical protein
VRNLLEQILSTRAELARLKPRARRRVALQDRLQVLMMKQIRREIRAYRKA